MKKTVSRLGSAALCVTLSLALGCGCVVMPPASSEKPASPAVSVPTDAEGKPLYDATRLDDGRLRILYGYDNSGDCRTVLCGSKVLYQSARSETVSLLQDIVTGETNYWFRTWSDSTGRGGRRSALYDKDGNEVMAFDGEQSATIYGHRAEYRTGDTVFILDRTTMGHRDIAAFLTRRFHGFFNRCTGDHLRILRAAIQHVETSDSCNAQRGSHAYPYTRQHRFIHGSSSFVAVDTILQPEPGGRKSDSG